ncbi:MAG: ribonucleoside-diphosphate reductase subunit alpha, partial [Prevotella sp.]|nr:ribonucleoside-diphosphate reductase subunit alpha [Prevotella sp.]
MDITKRNGAVEPYNREKIATAIRKSFVSTGTSVDESKIYAIVDEVEATIKSNPMIRTVECIQDEVEKGLMKNGFYAEAKNYILFRWKRAEQRRTLTQIADMVECHDITDVLKGIVTDYQENEYSISLLSEKFMSFSKSGMSGSDKLSALIKAAVELTTQDAPDWEFIAGRLLAFKHRKELESFQDMEGLQTFYEKLRYLTDEKLYGSYILASYSEDEITKAAQFMKPERDHLLNYSGLDLLIKRYLIRNFSNKPIEGVQEMFLGIALHLAMNEQSNRMMWVQKFYDMLSKLEVTMATPTLSNARKPFHQLSSCFIDTVPDSLEGIYRSLDNFSQVSKFGGGMGLYFGKVRAVGGRIRGFKG